MSTTIIYASVDANAFYSVWSTSPTYATARAGNALFEDGTAAGGESLIGSDYNSMEGLLEFDTTAVGATPTSVVLTLTSNGGGQAPCVVQARLYNFGASVTTADWVAGGSLSALPLLAHFAMGGLGACDFADDAFPANVVLSGITRIMLVSAEQVAGTPPVDASGISFTWFTAPSGGGTPPDPYLTLTIPSALYQGKGIDLSKRGVT